MNLAIDSVIIGVGHGLITKPQLLQFYIEHYYLLGSKKLA